jgi:hypothetical protein
MITPPKKKGDRKTGGRVKGIPNKATRDVREAITKVLSDNSENFGKWLTTVAEGKKGKVKNGFGKVVDGWLVRPDPARAVEIAMNMAEYHIPKLARTEITGANGGPVIVQSSPVDEAL